MCFSASASFGAAVVLSTIGAASINKVQFRSQLAFASIPLIFAIQQTMEGFLWMALPNSAYSSIQHFTTYAFLFFAQIVWPVWVPMAILLLEKKKKRRTILKILVGIGIIESLYQIYCILNFQVNVRILGYHISYDLNYPSVLRYISSIFYLLPTIFSLFVSSVKRVWVVGLAILISCIISIIFYREYDISVWCFFASVISIAILAIMYQLSDTKITGLEVSADIS